MENREGEGGKSRGGSSDKGEGRIGGKIYGEKKDCSRGYSNSEGEKKN